MSVLERFKQAGPRQGKAASHVYITPRERLPRDASNAVTVASNMESVNSGVLSNTLRRLHNANVREYAISQFHFPSSWFSERGPYHYLRSMFGMSALLDSCPAYYRGFKPLKERSCIITGVLAHLSVGNYVGAQRYVGEVGESVVTLTKRVFSVSKTNTMDVFSAEGGPYLGLTLDCDLEVRAFSKAGTQLPKVLKLKGFCFDSRAPGDKLQVADERGLHYQCAWSEEVAEWVGVALSPALAKMEVKLKDGFWRPCLIMTPPGQPVIVICSHLTIDIESILSVVRRGAPIPWVPPGTGAWCAWIMHVVANSNRDFTANSAGFPTNLLFSMPVDNYGAPPGLSDFTAYSVLSHLSSASRGISALRLHHSYVDAVMGKEKSISMPTTKDFTSRPGLVTDVIFLLVNAFIFCRRELQKGRFLINLTAQQHERLLRISDPLDVMMFIVANYAQAPGSNLQ